MTWEEAIKEFLKENKWGKITLTVQNGKVVCITKEETVKVK